MEKLVNEFLKKENIFAVIGVSRDSNKYGHIVYFTLKKYGYRVFAVNPKIDKVEGDRVYPNLSVLPNKPDIVDFVVPPKIGLDVVKEAKKLGITRIWLQPGSESKEIIDYCKKNNMKVLHNICVMIEAANFLDTSN